MAMKSPGMSNVQWCWSARNKFSRTPSPDNANDILPEEIMVRDTLNREGLLKYQQKQARYVEKFTLSEKLKLASARKIYEGLRNEHSILVSIFKHLRITPDFNMMILQYIQVKNPLYLLLTLYLSQIVIVII